jgi:hypothetical protein
VRIYQALDLQQIRDTGLVALGVAVSALNQLSSIYTPLPPLRPHVHASEMLFVSFVSRNASSSRCVIALHVHVLPFLPVRLLVFVTSFNNIVRKYCRK